MPGYVQTFLDELQHPPPRHPQHSPHGATPIQYGTAPQYAELVDCSVPLAGADKALIPKVIGKLLYYARAVNSTLNVALSSLASEQNKPTANTQRRINQLLDYCATHPNARLTFHPSNMQLQVHSDAGYNNESNARSRTGGHFFLGATQHYNKLDTQKYLK
jgi:hypothetical protein